MRRLSLRDVTRSVEMQGFAYATFGCMDLVYHLIETKVGVGNITRHVRAGFGPDVCDEVGVTCISIAIFCFCLLAVM